MLVKVLIDNKAADASMGEWGLSIYIEHEGHRILLDTGASARFADNARALGVELSQVEYGVLSHAHFDHANGMEAFFRENTRARFYLRAESAENCYHYVGWIPWYIGIRKGYLKRFADRIEYVSGDYQLYEGAYLVPHKTENLAAIGRRMRMCVRSGLRFRADDFSHEQSLVLRTEKGLVVFNSCSHGGADNIIREVADTFPGERIYAIIGGFHLYRTNDQQVNAFARRVLDTGIERVVTGHCTGERAYELLKATLDNRLEQLRVGYTLEL